MFWQEQDGGIAKPAGIDGIAFIGARPIADGA